MVVIISVVMPGGYVVLVSAVFLVGLEGWAWRDGIAVGDLDGMSPFRWCVVVVGVIAEARISL